MSALSYDSKSPRHPFVEMYIGSRKTPITVVHSVEEAASQTTAAQLAIAVVEMTYTVTVAGRGNTLNLRVIDPSFDRFEKTLLEDKETLWIRFGWRFSDGSEYATPEIPLLIVNWTGEFVGGATFVGTSLNVTAIDDAYLLGVQVSQAAFPPSTTITEAIRKIVEDVARSRSASPRVKVDIRVSSTTQLTDALNKVNNRSLLRYIQDIIKFADSEGLFLTYYSHHEEGSWSLVIDQVNPNRPPMRTYVFSRSRTSEMINFRANYNGLLVRAAGGGRSSIIGADGSSFSFTPYKSDAEKEQDQAHAEFFPREPIDEAASRQTLVSARDQKLIEVYERSRRRIADKARYAATADVVGDPGLLPIRNVAVLVPKGAHTLQAQQALFREADYHHSSGIYTVYGITHSISPGVFRSQLTLHRASGGIGALVAAGQQGSVFGLQKWVRDRMRGAAAKEREQEAIRWAQRLGTGAE